MAGELSLEVVTPERRVLSAKVLSLVAPGAEGEFGVLPGHVGFMTPLSTGILAWRTSDGFHAMVVSRGFAEVSQDKVVVLAEHADLAAEIDLQKAEADLKAFEDRIRGKGSVDADFAHLRAEVERAAAKITLAGRR